ncbi:MAG: NADH-quinone oxidoreductase subunit L [Phycisphaerae bacterium]
MDESAIRTWSILTILLPLAGAVVAGALGPLILRGRSHWPVILGVGGALVGSVILFGQVRGAGDGHQALTITVYEWLALRAGSWVNVEFLIDPLTVVMLLVVTGISLLVVIYSRDYMRDQGKPVHGYERFFAYLGLFVFSMCTLVLGGNFLLLYLGWEAVGLCSYLLIGFYYGKPSAAAAAKKAFLVNRVGDFGFGLGILLIYMTFNSLDYATVFGMVENGVTWTGASLTGGRVTAIALLLLCGAIGKSAQIPLFVWLPDAMEGPSPVSALIHAATMVTAGVYMVARCGVIFAASPLAMAVVAVIGALTALFAATIALTQHDMKRILAYSTISQLGYMFLGLGVSAAGAAIFHLYTHAFFKALLFLAAGSVMHSMGGIIDLRRFSGLRRVMPWTYATMLVGALALAGFPLLSGFWSKDEIIHAAFVQSRFLGFVAMGTALLTALYTFRMFFRAFHGVTRVPEGVHAHESGGWMIAPLVVLALGAVLAGYIGVQVGDGGMLGLFKPHGDFHHFLEPAMAPFAAATHEVPATSHLQEFGLMYASAVLAVFGILVAYFFYVDSPMLAMVVQRIFPTTHRILAHKYYVDELYDRWIVSPLHRLGRFFYGVDEYFIDSLVWLVTAVPRVLGLILRTLQRGALQGYGASMMLGLAVIMVLVLMGSLP